MLPQDHALLDHLRDTGFTTASRAAAAIGCSERTLFRTLARLRMAGYRINASPGTGGGIKLARVQAGVRCELEHARTT